MHLRVDFWIIIRNLQMCTPPQKKEKKEKNICKWVFSNFFIPFFKHLQMCISCKCRLSRWRPACRTYRSQVADSSKSENLGNSEIFRFPLFICNRIFLCGFPCNNPQCYWKRTADNKGILKEGKQPQPTSLSFEEVLKKKRIWLGTATDITFLSQTFWHIARITKSQTKPILTTLCTD